MSSAQPSIQAPLARFRLRVRYVKRSRLTYLGHLEVIHTIERCVRRARLPYAVTQGFSPHMRIGYTAALPVGTGSACEYFDVFLTELVPVGEAFARLRAATPSDLEPVAAAYIDLRAPALTADITRLSYRIEFALRPGFKADAERVAAGMDAICALPELPYLRGSKRKTLNTGLLLSYHVAALPEGRVRLDLETRCDNEGSLRPEIILAALDQALRGIEPGSEDIASTGIQDFTAIGTYRVERTAQYVEAKDGSLIDPLP